jgi:dolichyl-phosphate beta-glucosyltransferase
MLQGFLFAGILVALFVDDVMEHDRGRGLFLALLGLSLVALLPVLPYPSTAPAMPSYFTSGVRQLPEGSVALIAPYARSSQGEAMLWQAVARMWFRMPEGYMFVPNPAVNSADPPASATQTALVAAEQGHAPSLDDGLRQSLLADLDRWQVAAVIVGPMAHRDQVVGLYTELLGKPPQWTEGVALWRR